MDKDFAFDHDISVDRDLVIDKDFTIDKDLTVKRKRETSLFQTSFLDYILTNHLMRYSDLSSPILEEQADGN